MKTGPGPDRRASGPGSTGLVIAALLYPRACAGRRAPGSRPRTGRDHQRSRAVRLRRGDPAKGRGGGRHHRRRRSPRRGAAGNRAFRRVGAIGPCSQSGNGYQLGGHRVRPDVPVDAALALRAAHLRALERLLAAEGDPEQRTLLQRAIDGIESAAASS